jgi:hypothetical protein
MKEGEDRHALGQARGEGRLVTQVQYEVDSEGAVGQRANAADLGYCFVGRPPEAAEDAQPAGRADRGNQAGIRIRWAIPVCTIGWSMPRTSQALV